MRQLPSCRPLLPPCASQHQLAHYYYRISLQFYPTEPLRVSMFQRAFQLWQFSFIQASATRPSLHSSPLSSLQESHSESSFLNSTFDSPPPTFLFFASHPRSAAVHLLRPPPPAVLHTPSPAPPSLLLLPRLSFVAPPPSSPTPCPLSLSLLLSNRRPTHRDAQRVSRHAQAAAAAAPVFER